MQLDCIEHGPANIPKHGGGTSIIDISMASAAVAAKCNLKTETQTLGSDHFPSNISYNERINYDQQSKPKWIQNKADWIHFSELCRASITRELLTDNIEETNSNITIAILDAAKASIPRTAGKISNRKINLPYWNDACTEAVEAREAARKVANKSGREVDNIEFKRRKGIAQRTIKNASREYWQKYCSRLTDGTRLAPIWKMSRKMNGIHDDSVAPVLTYKNIQAESIEEKAELLAQAFSDTSSSSNYTPSFIQHKNQVEAEFNILTPPTNPKPYASHLNDEFNLAELEKAIKQLKTEKSPGQDDITYEMIKHLPRKSIKVLLQFYNKILKADEIPSPWKHAEIIAFPKPDKDNSNPVNYRPISLTAVLCKLNERLITNRLVWYLEANNLLSRAQAGFRQGRSTIDQLIKLTDTIIKSLGNKEFCEAVFLDMEKAYDMVWQTGLLIKLRNMGIGGKILTWIRNFISNRTFQVRIGNVLSGIYTLENGIAQGSIIAPILFLIFINDFPDGPPGMEKSLFADDAAVYKTSKNISHLTEVMQKYLEEITTWSNLWGFKININKTVCTVFTNRRKQQKPVLKINGNELKIERNPKFLGVIMDERLVWQHCIEYIAGKCNRRLNLMRSVQHNEWGASKKALLLIYKALIRPILDYACAAIDNISDSMCKRLESIQYQALRICCSARFGTSLESLQNELGEMPLKYRRLENIIKLTIKIKSNENHTAKEILQDNWRNYYGSYNGNKQPIRTKVQDFYSKYRVEENYIKIQATPPWLDKDYIIDLSLTKRVKKSDIPAVLEANGKELIEYYQDKLAVYTDGSKTETGKVAAACVVPSIGAKRSARITDDVTIYAAELQAIIMAVDTVDTAITDSKEIAVFSDSKSVLESLDAGKSLSRPTLYQTLTAKLNASKHKFSFIWIPSHCNIHGNEAADQEAKQATELISITEDIGMEVHDYYKLARKYSLEKWQQAYSSSDKSAFYKTLEPAVTTEIKYVDSEKRREVLITRLRLGKCSLNEYLYKIKRHQTGSCDRCGKPESVKHFLIECNGSELTGFLNAFCTRRHLEFNLSTVLSNRETRDIIYKEVKNGKRQL